jgi:hypothetical protein
MPIEYYDYDFIDDTTKSYFFKTNAHVFYRIEFKPTGYIFGEDVIWSNYCYEFSIKLSANSPQNPPLDFLVAPTIAAIFIDFFQEKEKAILYTCDTADRKHTARMIKFNRWFEQFNKGQFFKINASLIDNFQKVTYFNSLIIRVENPYKEAIITAFEDLMGGLEDDK